METCTISFRAGSDSKPSIEKFKSNVIDVQLVLDSILLELRLHQNLKLSDYVDQAQYILNSHKGPKDRSVLRIYKVKSAVLCRPNPGVIISSLFGDF